ncbi:MAG TPA: amidohydrolase family protein [Acidimicrobiia bacterium]|jgi:cytosine/adenosine deaminase-related metal-dependent hydrolase
MTPTRTIIRGGIVVTMDPTKGTLATGDVLVEGERIAAVEPSLGEVDAFEIDATDRVVLPGFVDTHRHTWQSLIRHVSTDWTLPQYFTGVRGVLGRRYTPEDMYAANLVGALEALDSGITTLVDWSHNNNTPEHADAAIQALRDTGMRAVFAYGNSNDEWIPVSDVPHSRDVLRIRDEHFPSAGGLVTLAMSLRGPQFTTPEVTRHDFDLAREAGTPITVHVGDGLWGLNKPLEQLEAMGLLGEDVTYVHCNTIGDAEFDLIARSGGCISVAPELEMHMGHGELAALRAVARSIPVSLSIDVCTSVGGDMFSAMRAVLAGSRYLVNLEAIDAGTVVETLPLLAPDVLGFATRGGARAAWLDDEVGTLTPGKQADMAMVRLDSWPMVPLNYPLGAVVESGNPRLVDTVLVAGKVRKQDGELVDHDLGRVRRLAEAARDRILEAAGVTEPGAWQPKPYTGDPAELAG